MSEGQEPTHSFGHTATQSSRSPDKDGGPVKVETDVAELELARCASVERSSGSRDASRKPFTRRYRWQRCGG